MTKREFEEMIRLENYVKEEIVPTRPEGYPDILGWDFDALYRIQVLYTDGYICEELADYLRSLLFEKALLYELAYGKSKELHERFKDRDVSCLQEIFDELEIYHLYDYGFGHYIDDRGFMEPKDDLKEERIKGEFGPVVIDSYHYCDYLEENKEDAHRKHVFTDYEKGKNDILTKKLEEYVTITEGKDQINNFHHSMPGKIYFRYDTGYVTDINPDRDEVIFYYYGDDEETAFISAIAQYELNNGRDYEWSNRGELAKDFAERFPDMVNERGYYAMFYPAEYALKQLRKYYGNYIPEELKAYFEKFLGEEFRYDYELNQVVKREKNLEPTLKPQE